MSSSWIVTHRWGATVGKFWNSDAVVPIAALTEKGETGEEIAAAAKVMARYAVPVPRASGTLLDTCGTGGDGSGSFNISTAAAIVCSLFVPVAKHGNRAMSSRSGSADVLEALGEVVVAGDQR